MALPILKLGSKGKWVNLLQRKLIKRGYDVGRWGADGDFGDATHEALRKWQRDHDLEVSGVVDEPTWRSLGAVAKSKGVQRSDKGTGAHLAMVAHKVVTGGYGHPKPRYRFGAEQPDHELDNPENWKILDCSECTQGLATYETGKVWVDGARFQYLACKAISVERAKGTPGALLFMHGKVDGVRDPYIHHVGVSLGNGYTAELRSTAMGAGVWKISGRPWTHGGLIPGIRY
jgi:hypothetical protein